MRITNQSETPIPYISGNGALGVIPAFVTFHPATRKITLKIEHLPCQLELEDEPVEGNNRKKSVVLGVPDGR